VPITLTPLSLTTVASGSVSSQLPPVSAAMSTMTAPAFMPATIAALERRWGITVGERLPGGTSSYVAAAVTATGEPAAGRGAPLVGRVMRDQGGGSIMYTASVSSLGASMEYAHYGASKAGIANLVQTMALELVGHGVRVNAVSPGPLDTPQSRDVLGSDEAMERARESWPLVPMNRLGLPEEVAAAFAFLASDDASYITGINLVVDGGLIL